MFVEFRHAPDLPARSTKPVWIRADNVDWFDVHLGYVRATLASGNVLFLETTPEEFMNKITHAGRFVPRKRDDR